MIIQIKTTQHQMQQHNQPKSNDLDHKMPEPGTNNQTKEKRSGHQMCQHNQPQNIDNNVTQPNHTFNGNTKQETTNNMKP